MSWMENNYWTTLDKRKLRPKDFSDKHLINTIKYIENKAPVYKTEYELSLIAIPEPMGDGASMCFEAEEIRIERMSTIEWLSCFCNIYSLLVKEANKRKLLTE